METKDCLAKYLHSKDLEELIKSHDNQIDFVFIASCHSEFAAKIFQRSGVKHVIGIKYSETIKDEAVIAFT
jgi:hypothetical protein